MIFDNQRKQAIVIGSSMAGLLTARILSDHFADVTIIEKDPVNPYPESRPGQGQTRHLHVLLAQGLLILTKLFPGLEEKLLESGAIRCDMGADWCWYSYGGYKIQFKSGLVGIQMSRPFLEWHIRQQVLGLPNVSLKSSCVAKDLVFNPEPGRVVGIKINSRDDSSELETLEANLIIDATGRGSSTPKLLEKYGYPRPSLDEVKINLGYATRRYRRLPNILPGATSLLISTSPPNDQQGGFLVPIENNQWILTLGGVHGNYPSNDEAEFREFIRNLRVPDIYNIIKEAEPLSEISVFRFPSSRRYRYEQLKRFPEGYLVLGDAFASFNPLYGQGMTSAIMQAQVLDQVLAQRSSLNQLWQLFFKRVSEIIETPWQIAVGEDFGYSQTRGNKPFGTNLRNAYIAKVNQATHHDRVVYKQFLQVLNLMESPTSLMHPRLLWRVLFA